jgi:hypothetical protein
VIPRDSCFWQDPHVFRRPSSPVLRISSHCVQVHGSFLRKYQYRVNSTAAAQGIDNSSETRGSRCIVTIKITVYWNVTPYSLVYWSLVRYGDQEWSWRVKQNRVAQHFLEEKMVTRTRYVRGPLRPPSLKTEHFPTLISCTVLEQLMPRLSDLNANFHQRVLKFLSFI